MARYVANFLQNGEQIVMGLVNNDNGTAFTPAQIIFGVPASAEDAENAMKTNLQLTAASGSGYTGSVTVAYNRVDLSFMETLAPDWVIVTDELRTTDLIDLLNEKYGLALTAADIVDEALPEILPDAEAIHELKAAAGSLVFGGSTVLTFTAPTQPLSEVLTVTDLDGLYAPEALPAVEEPSGE